ncbi:hypothetical protein PROP_02565 [Propionicimonas sp. T2.31MG-18]|uniref:ROK family transcriptional regulator n=1 Tax=Propionicimonas sp. T2.31MG-18 TaxID=3157620 RepID=UPI0035EE4260
MSPAVDMASPRDWAMEHIYRLIQESTSMTRPALVARSGLPASTVGHAVARLLDSGRIVEGERPPKGPGTGSGRPPRVFRVPVAPSVGAAISFRADRIDIAIGDARGRVLTTSTITLEPGRGGDEAELACDGLEALCQARQVSALSGVVAGLSSSRARLLDGGSRAALRSAPHRLGRRLADRLGDTAVEIDSRIYLATYGELHLGTGRCHENFVLCHPAEPDEVGIVLNGRVYRGGVGIAGRLPATRGFAGSIASVCTLLNPTAVVISDDGSEAVASMISTVRQAIDALTPPAIAAGVEVVAGELGAGAGVRGSLLRAGQVPRVANLTRLGPSR